MGADPAPDHVGLPVNLLFSILEGCSAVISPGHFEYAVGSLHTLDAEAHKLSDGYFESLLVFGR